MNSPRCMAAQNRCTTSVTIRSENLAIDASVHPTTIDEPLPKSHPPSSDRTARRSPRAPRPRARLRDDRRATQPRRADGSGSPSICWVLRPPREPKRPLSARSGSRAGVTGSGVRQSARGHSEMTGQRPSGSLVPKHRLALPVPYAHDTTTRSYRRERRMQPSTSTATAQPPTSKSSTRASRPEPSPDGTSAPSVLFPGGNGRPRQAVASSGVTCPQRHPEEEPSPDGPFLLRLGWLSSTSGRLGF